ncbi:hypothetical protein [Streptomyces sp. NPDC003090]|uniref:hypothetical protein n=1 Tax=Streptomyces sp. NPDC003090 TaxID=3154274 RepID=UPI00381118DF
MRAVFPYPTLFGDIDLDVTSVSVDGSDLPYSRISRPERTVALHQTGRRQWDSAILNLQATLPVRELADGPWSEVVCLATLSEKATNARTTARLTRGDDDTWRGSVELARARHLGRVDLSLVVAATCDGVPGRLIGTLARNWVVDLKGATPVRQRDVEIVEVDFSQGSPDWLHAFKESPWVVETTGDMPTLYLNSGAVEGLMDVLRGSGGGPAEQTLREMTASQVASDVWTAMFHTAISDLDVDEDGTPVLPTGWRESVLTAMLPDVLPGRPLTDALYDIEERRAKGFGWAELQTRVQYAAGRRSQIAKKLTHAVRSVNRAQEHGA